MTEYLYWLCLKYALDHTKRDIGLDGPQGSEWMFDDINAYLKMWPQAMPTHRK